MTCSVNYLGTALHFIGQEDMIQLNKQISHKIQWKSS